MAAISAEYDKNVKPWLELAEDLRALSLDTALNVPQICVMGDQSSGKSSVLEALSGVPFPRGSGLVTRCPVRLVMRRADAGAKWSALASTSNSSQQIAAESPGELTAIIARLTESLTMSPSGFSSESIIVQLSSPESPDLTVIDLPGIVRTVTAGQTASVISDVNTLIDSFLEQERTIILAVIPANQDIATVDILERAMRVDPTGERTIGVLTKPDLIGPGNEEEVLTNVRKPLKLGYIMVKNRSQLAIKQNMTGEAAKAELLVVRIQTELAPMKRTVETLLSKVRHLNDCVRGEYRDRIIVCNPNLRLYTRALVVFSELQSRGAASV